MSENEKTMAQTIENALPAMREADQKYLLGYAEGVLAASKRKSAEVKAGDAEEEADAVD